MSDTDLLNDAAVNLLATMGTEPREPGDKLRWQDKARILDLRAQGRSQEDIAEVIGCHQTTVSRTLADMDDSRPFARRLLEANAVTIVEDILRNLKSASMAEKTKILGKLDVIRDDRQDGSNQMIVMIGTADQPLKPPAISVPGHSSWIDCDS